MRSAGSFVLDFALILLATVGALMLRENFDVSPAHWEAFVPYAAATALAACAIIPLFSLNKCIWRLSSTADYRRVVTAVVAIVICTVCLTFTFNRLEGVARSLPLLQGLLTAVALVASRVLARERHMSRRNKATRVTPFDLKPEEKNAESVLVVGLSRVAETYLQAVADFAPRRLKVVGLLGRKARHVGRRIGAHEVLGVPEAIDDVLRDLEVHGIVVDRIAVTMPFHALSPEARSALLKIERSGSIKVQFLIDQMGLGNDEPLQASQPKNYNNEETASVRFALSDGTAKNNAARLYWSLKRAVDICGALILLVIAAPIMLAASALLVTAIGSPVVFWQQRPGLGGRAFRLYKFRTMEGAHNSDGQPLSDDERTFALGNFMRRTRLDELPQLFNILRGDMSFVGPRPLLPRDQCDTDRARLLVRPGLTGWAQVVGGRAISADDKAALDVWYVQNASLLLDVSIMLRTVPIVLFGERISPVYIARAWHDLANTGVLDNELSSPTHKAPQQTAERDFPSAA